MDFLQHTTTHVHRHHWPVPHWLIHFGVLGLFAVAVLDASIIPLPIPGSTDLLVLILATQHSALWLLVTIAAGGSVIGGYSAWSAGKRGGEAILERYVPKRFLSKLNGWMKRHGTLGVCVASVLPPPIPLLPFLLAAGVLDVTRKRFLCSFAIARTVRYGLVAWLGARYGRRLVRLWSYYLADWASVILWIFIGLLVSAVLFGVLKYRHDQRAGRVQPARVP